MTKSPTIWLALCVAALLAGSLAEAGVSGVYFSRNKKIEGQIYRTPSELPGETKVLDAGQDRVVYLYVVFSDVDSHTLRGELRGADGNVVGTMSRQIGSVTRAGIRWRSITHEFRLDGLAPGQYRIDLIVDDAKAGTYSFTLK
jgi:hypothetical protein